MKKTIFVLTIIAVLAISLYEWLTNGNENEEKAVENTEEVKEPAGEKEENVKDQAEEAKTEDTVNETITNN